MNPQPRVLYDVLRLLPVRHLSPEKPEQSRADSCDQSGQRLGIGFAGTSPSSGSYPRTIVGKRRPLAQCNSSPITKFVAAIQKVIARRKFFYGSTHDLAIITHLVITI